MPIKRPHSKSRYGCDQCRKRRVKCDEKLPHCSICISRGEFCQYSRLPRGQDPTHRLSSTLEAKSATEAAHCMPPHGTDGAFRPKPTTQESFPTSRNVSLAQNRLRELELMHYWCTRTYTSFMKDFEIDLRDHIVREAIRHEYLMEALLALTSLHMATESRAISTSVIEVSEALHYQNKAVAGLRSTLDELSPDNCDALFMTSLIIMVCTLVSSLLQGQGNHIAQTTAEAMLKLGDFLKGLRLILEVSRTWPEDGPVGHMLRTRGAMITAIIKFPTMEIPTMGLPLEETRRFNRMRNGTKVEEQIFRHAIDLLEESIHGTRLLFLGSKR